MSSPQRGESGLLDLFVMLIAVAIVVMVGYAYVNRQPRNRTGINCVNSLKQIGLSFRIWSGDNGNKMPAQVSTNMGGTKEFVASGTVFPHFAVMSNELGTTWLLTCWRDSQRSHATNFAALRDVNLSYFVVPEADESIPRLWLSGDRNLATNNVPLNAGLFNMPTNRLLGWTAQMHGHQGNLAFADGSVQQYTSSGLQRSATNALSTWFATTNAPFRLAIP